MKKYKVVLGLGRMSNHHRMELVVEAKDAEEAMSVARRKLAKLCAQFLEQVAPVIAEEDAQDSTYAEAEEEDEADYENRRLENRVFAAQLNEEES